MRLINTDSMKMEEFFGTQVPRYIILSHTWGADEISFQDYIEGYKKIYDFAHLAKMLRRRADKSLRDPVKHIWIDTCCINKESSAELSEAINSMYAWYRQAHTCIALLSDVEIPVPGLRVLSDVLENWIGESRWFTRGWTLQELIAPRSVTFYDKEWKQITERYESAREISAITGIEPKILAGEWDLSRMTVAQRMSWAARRETTRAEDIAYCLLGIFGVNMPLLYGEGDNAFHRLQQEILKSTSDQSIFAWGLDEPLSDEPVSRRNSMLARHPRSFERCGHLE
ncbi:hypothetical protein B0T16DRAFT_307820, partial [Cercophora newfieldiana]